MEGKGGTLTPVVYASVFSLLVRCHLFPSSPASPSINQVYKEVDLVTQPDFGVSALCNTVNNLLDISDLLGGGQQVVTVGSILRNQSQFQQFLESEYGVRPGLAQELLQARVNQNAVSGDTFMPTVSGM